MLHALSRPGVFALGAMARILNSTVVANAANPLPAERVPATPSAPGAKFPKQPLAVGVLAVLLEGRLSEPSAAAE